MPRRKSRVRYIALAFVFVSGVISGWYLNDNFAASSHASYLREKHMGQHEGYFTNPLLNCHDEDKDATLELLPFRTYLSGQVERLKAKHKVDSISVYFRDLNNGPSFGINHNDPFTPGSLMKLHVLLAYMKIAQADPAVMTKKLAYRSTGAYARQSYAPPDKMVEGQSYTIENLLARMIIYSDNEATIMLSDADRDGVEDLVLKELDLPPRTSSTRYFITPKQYASMLRVLYNASYLNKDTSEWALYQLSRSTFTVGLPAGLPPNIKVAHKFGEHGDTEGIKQLHDCGIVYYPDHPYLLCIMTRGRDYTSLSKTLAEVSNIVYKEVNRQVNLPDSAFALKN